NILLTRDKTKTRIIAKLADFGCAISDEWTFQMKNVNMASKASAQTPGYDPPEYPKFSGSSDVWQLALVFVCVCNYQKEPPRSRMYPKGKQWNQVQPAGPHYSWELSRALRSCLVEDPTQRPGALKSWKYITDAYTAIQRSLPADPQPLEIFGRVEHGNKGTRNAVSSNESAQRMLGPDYGYAMADVWSEQAFRRPGPAGHMFSDPEAGRIGRIPHNSMNFLNSRRLPHGLYSDGRYTGEVLYPHGDWFDEEDQYYVQGSGPSMFGVQHQGFFPPLHPRRSRFGRRY
ncbi:hypothetical protein T440DRAFT_386124, partial [Plenodomus tracheiphilus IPT5]